MIKNLIKYTTSLEFRRLVLIAILGAILGFITYEIIYYFNPFTPKATLSWILAFIIGTARQHALHRHFTFLFKTHYWESLYRAYILDFGVLIITTAINWFLTVVIHLNHRLAWFCCLVITALISLIFLKQFVFKNTVNQKS